MRQPRSQMTLLTEEERVTADHLIAIGFERCGDELRAPGGARVSLTALDGRCYRLSITLPNGGASRRDDGVRRRGDA